MNSLDFYSVIKDVYDIEFYSSVGIRKCNVFKKNTESLKDYLLVSYPTGEKRLVNGEYLYSTLSEALEQINSDKKNKIDEIKRQIDLLQDSIKENEDFYNSIEIIEGND